MEININKIVDKITFKCEGKLTNEQVTNLKHQVSMSVLDAFKQIPNSEKINVDCMVKNIVIE